MQLDFSNPETIHVALMVGQYVFAPFAYWVGKKVKNSIVEELKAHVDEKLDAHERSEMKKFEELGSRITRLEDVVMRRGARPAAWGRRDAKGRFAVSDV